MQLVIAEKPSVAKNIAEVIGAVQKRDGYLEGNDFLVSWCIGHLVELAPPESYSEQWRSWNYESLPIIPRGWRYVIKKNTEKQFHILCKLLHDARVTTVICATDAGREGELIFRLVVKEAGCKKPMKRLWLSSMEQKAIQKGMACLKPGSDYDNLYASALCRQQADWLVGMNGTRLFTVLYGGKTLKVGRVQTPTLNMLVQREEEIRVFVKEKYFLTHIVYGEIEAVTEKRLNQTEAEEIAEACLGRQASVISVKKEQKQIAPPKLYDLTTLQRDANRLFGFTAKQTLEYLQSLYEKKLITYPRTDSQFLTEDMNATVLEVLNAMQDKMPFIGGVHKVDISRILDNKKVTDHHAIIPTVEMALADLAFIPKTEKKILSLVAVRLVCAVEEVHHYQNTKAEILCEGYSFVFSGKMILKQGWKEHEKAFRLYFNIEEDKENEEIGIPELADGMCLKNVETEVSQHYTSPPKHFTEDSLLAAMERAGSDELDKDAERKGLGTPATRADIIEKLVKDGYVNREKKQLIPTEEGVRLITILPEVIKTPSLTAEWENALALVAKGEKDRDEFMEGIHTLVAELVHSYHRIRDEPKKRNIVVKESLGACPNCGNPVHMGKFGAFCTGKCGMNVSRAMGVLLTEEQVKKVLAGKRILLKGLKGKLGKNYDVYLIPVGIESYSYTRDDKEMVGIQYKFQMEFLKKND